MKITKAMVGAPVDKGTVRRVARRTRGTGELVTYTAAQLNNDYEFDVPGGAIVGNGRHDDVNGTGSMGAAWVVVRDDRLDVAWPVSAAQFAEEFFPVEEE